MFLIVHATVGAAIGERLEPPAFSFWAGFLSHFVADIIPHGDERSGRLLFCPERLHWLVILAIIDGLAAMSLIAVLWLGGFFNNAIGAMAGALGAIMPDVLAGFSELSHGKLWPHFARFHERNHKLINYEIPLVAGGVVPFGFFLVTIYLSR